MVVVEKETNPLPTVAHGHLSHKFETPVGASQTATSWTEFEFRLSEQTTTVGDCGRLWALLASNAT